MKKLNVLFAFFIISTFIRCTEEEVASTKKDIDPAATVSATWKLAGLVNISDEDKYLNSILDLKTTKEYTLTNNDGVTITSGTAEYTTASTISLNHGLFEDYPVELEIIKLSSTELWLKEHYTLDNKDAYLEYHWTKQ